ncbi:hypothetical protein [Breoghania sp.]|uniref:hypothetical protein n=1 Tax=Breoghania sp. TaxID=2065378 RepID=UPI002AA9505C|nr:hypothetical protein [Breoghania sp.]
MKKQLQAGLVSALMASSVMMTSAARADQVFIQDVIIQGSLCTGVDCVNGEAFGFDTIVLKENNLRIFFNDTSSSGSFPNVDWRLIANETNNGGQNMFAIEDSTNSKKPFFIEANSPNNLVHLDSAGRVGIKTSSPAVDLHVLNGNSPTLRLEQDGSAGFSPQTWDVAANETNFFIRDVTNASRLPFRIVPAAPSNSLYIAADGDVGLGTATPDGPFQVENGAGTDDDFIVMGTGYVGIGTNAPTVPLQIYGESGVASINVTEASSSATPRDLVALKNNGGVFMSMEDTDTAIKWNFQNQNGEARITSPTGAGIEFQLTTDGDLTITGSLTTSGATCSVTPCDAVFDSAKYEVPSIEEHAAAMWKNKYLPAVGPTTPDQPFNVTSKLASVLNELEHAHIYIEQLNSRIASLELAVHSGADEAK